MGWLFVVTVIAVMALADVGLVEAIGYIFLVPVVAIVLLFSAAADW